MKCDPPVGVLTRAAFAIIGLSIAACGDAIAPDGPFGVATWPLDAFCIARVDGSGDVDVEDDYLAHVVACENGAADYEALRAQAVAARSYLYYRLETGDGSIEDGQSDQVYTCGRPPRAEHYEAVISTAGLVVQYRGSTVATFYVSGAIPSADDCVARPDDVDPHGVEHFVTYNWDRSGDDVVQTRLGWVNPANLRNRGCQSQNGANCLSQHGWDHADILRFYYGMDIEIVRAEGACVDPPMEIPDAEPDPGPPDAEPERPDAEVEPNPDPPDAFVSRPNDDAETSPDPPDAMSNPTPGSPDAFIGSPPVFDAAGPSAMVDGGRLPSPFVPEATRSEFKGGCAFGHGPAPAWPWLVALMGLLIRPAARCRRRSRPKADLRGPAARR